MKFLWRTAFSTAGALAVNLVFQCYMVCVDKLLTAQSIFGTCSVWIVKMKYQTVVSLFYIIKESHHYYSIPSSQLYVGQLSH